MCNQPILKHTYQNMCKHKLLVEQGCALMVINWEATKTFVHFESHGIPSLEIFILVTLLIDHPWIYQESAFFYSWECLTWLCSLFIIRSIMMSEMPSPRTMEEAQHYNCRVHEKQFNMNAWTCGCYFRHQSLPFNFLFILLFLQMEFFFFQAFSLLLRPFRLVLHVLDSNDTVFL